MEKGQPKSATAGGDDGRTDQSRSWTDQTDLEAKSAASRKGRRSDDGRAEGSGREDQQQTQEEEEKSAVDVIQLSSSSEGGGGNALPVIQLSSSSEGGGGNALPNLYSKFVTSFESVIQTLSTEEESTQRRQKLPSLDLEGVAAFIREEKPGIVFMVGAGISTSAGIPDFRTPGTGLYDNLKQYDIPHPQAIFEINFFKKNPEPFFVLAKELFHENIKPTPAHHFIRLVEEKGLLRRCFTQNIDALEYLAGVKDDKIVTAHGSHRTSTCLSCRKKYGQQWLMEQIKKATVPHCDGCKKGVVKPDIVFFGESLPPRFFSCSLVDLPKCELLIILGTSLVVHPFASLVDSVPEETPRLLINLQPVGTDALQYREPGNFRDVYWEGECDAGVMRLATLLGWKTELEAMIKTSKEK